MATQFNERTGREMETMTHAESLALATQAGCPERIDKFFSNGQEFAWAEYIHEAINKPAKQRRQRMSEKYGLEMLSNGDDK